MEIATAVSIVCSVSLGIIIFCGVIGNILSIVIWSTGRRCKKMSCGHYFKLIAIADIYSLIVSGIPMLLEISPAKIIIYDYHIFLCRFIPFSGHFGVQLSSWTTVCVTIERTLGICSPVRCQNNTTKKRAYCLMGIISAIAFCLDIYPLVFYELHPVQKLTPSDDFSHHPELNVTNVTANTSTSIECVAVKHILFYKIWNLYISFGCFVVVLPPLVILISNALTLYRLRQQLHSRHKQSPKQSRYSSSFSFTLLIITIGAINCISTMPIGYLYIQVEYFNTESSPVFFRVAGLLFYLNSGTNVILYS